MCGGNCIFPFFCSSLGGKIHRFFLVLRVLLLQKGKMVHFLNLGQGRFIGILGRALGTNGGYCICLFYGSFLEGNIHKSFLIYHLWFHFH